MPTIQVDKPAHNQLNRLLCLLDDCQWLQWWRQAVIMKQFLVSSPSKDLNNLTFQFLMDLL